jgi:Binding-protein-dependent transport system inner membrane component
MEIENRRAQLTDRFCDRLVGAAEGRMRFRFRGLLELVAGGEQILQSVVVQGLGERPPFALLCVERVREQARTLGGEAADELGAAGEKQREQCVNSDLPAIQGTVLFGAFFIVVANIVVDILYAFLDPRVRY